MHFVAVLALFAALLQCATALTGTDGLLSIFTTFLMMLLRYLDQNPSVWDIVNKDSRLTVLAAALKAADLEEGSKEPGSGTIFAPTDAAFAKVPPAVVQRLSDPKNKDELARLLVYHVIGDQSLTSAQLLRMNLPTRLETLTGDFVTVAKQGNQIKVNDATVVTADVVASNGIIHLIDTVLSPPPSNE